MNEIVSEPTPETAPDSPETAEKKPKEEGSFLWFLVKLVLFVLIFRTFIFSTFSIPSESMLPRLMVGDFLFTSKWPYGFSRASLPVDIDIGDGTLFASLPERGDVVVFKHPIDRTDYIKRVIGLPGDTMQMVAGVIHIDGVPVKKERIADFVRPVGPYNLCNAAFGRFRERTAGGTVVCRYPRFRETLPNGRSYDVLDFGLTDIDTTEAIIVPEGHVFMMGDNRDNSQDSRRESVSGGWVGMVPTENLVSRAEVIAFSTDGTSSWVNPVSWFTAARGERIGDGL